jgi:hypothetical protein
MVRDSRRSEHCTQDHCANQAPTTLVQMSQTKQHRRKQNRTPSRDASPAEDGQRETSVKELLANAGGKRQRQEGSKFDRRPWKDSFGQRMQSAPRFRRKAAHAAKIEPMQAPENTSSQDRSGHEVPAPRKGQSQLRRCHAVCPGSPRNYSCGSPLKSNGRKIKRNTLARPDVGLCQQFSQANSAAPRHNNAKHQEDQPDVPGHAGMKTRSGKTCNSRESMLRPPKRKHPYNESANGEVQS